MVGLSHNHSLVKKFLILLLLMTLGLVGFLINSTYADDPSPQGALSVPTAAIKADPIILDQLQARRTAVPIIIVQDE